MRAFVAAASRRLMGAASVPRSSEVVCFVSKRVEGAPRSGVTFDDFNLEVVLIDCNSHVSY